MRSLNIKNLPSLDVQSSQDHNKKEISEIDGNEISVSDIKIICK